MNNKFKLALAILLGLGIVGITVLYMLNTDIPVLNPKGFIALKEKELLVHATLLMLIIVLPVFVITFVFAWKYHSKRSGDAHSPNWDKHATIEFIWWGVPFAIVAVLSILTWKGCHELDPFRPLASNVKPIRIQVVALNWKWLFIYPEQNIATVNLVQFPEQTPINFEITADAPMNSFWIPHLGSQIYAMPGMVAKLHLIADEPGSYQGVSANLSGAGFAGMHFTATSCKEADFNKWVEEVRSSPKQLDLNEYLRLVKPSEYDPVSTYMLKKEDLFHWIVMKYMTPKKPGEDPYQLEMQYK